MMRIKELDAAFRVSFWGVDKGHGSMQAEILTQYFFNLGQLEKLKVIDFGSNYQQSNPYTGEVVNKRMKAMLFYMLQKKIEYREIELSSIEEGDLTWEEKEAQHLVPQMKYYIIDRYDNRDQPIFEHRGDHILDAFALANFVFVENVEKFFSADGQLTMTKRKDIDSVNNFNLNEALSKPAIRPITGQDRKMIVDIFKTESERNDEETINLHSSFLKQNKKIKVSSIRAFKGAVQRKSFM